MKQSVVLKISVVTQNNVNKLMQGVETNRVNYRQLLKEISQTYLKEVRLELVVQDDIEAQDFKAGKREVVAREASVVGVLECWISRNHSLDDDLIDTGPYLSYVVVLTLQPAVHR